MSIQQSRRQLKNLKIFTVTCCALAWIGIIHQGRAASPSEPAPQPATLSNFQERLARFLSEPRFASAQWGVKVVSLDTGITLFEHNSNRLLKPASNAKLYTGALALDRLGSDHRIHTTLLATREVSPSGTLDGDLIVLGRGDFSMAARFNEDDHSRSLEPLVNALVNAGVKQIRGDVIGDESYFQGPPFGHGWTWDDLQHYYGAQVSALSVNDNVVDLVFRPGSQPGEPCRISPSPDTTFLRFINRTRPVEAGGSPTIRLYRALGENVVHASGTLPIEGTRHVDS
ncbi:MAG TPA: D-alanyl-D-alanine carboxypeptidase, partial [Methylomirabilota bacterium]|nr:D-alanyl-D-alanine carboxypeptidase [Methylomirabilota bacterium]